MKDGFVIRKPTKIHSRSRARRMAEAKRKGRHSGYGMWFLLRLCETSLQAIHGKDYNVLTDFLQVSARVPGRQGCPLRYSG